jgi:hypothetical protein
LAPRVLPRCVQGGNEGAVMYESMNIVERDA